MGKDALSVRQKEFYEVRTRTYLPRRTYTVIRLDGRSFKTYTKDLKRPFDLGLVEDMDNTAIYLCKNIQGAKLAFVQSDEITIVLTDFDSLNTDAWFDGEVQKMTSISASMATEKFNQLRLMRLFSEGETNNKSKEEIVEIINKFRRAQFDSRAFTIPSKDEVMNNIQWRQQDTVRNSISSVAQSLYSHTELNGKNANQMQEMCFQKGVNWNDFDGKLKRGRLIIKQTTQIEVPINAYNKSQDTCSRSKWMSIAAPMFNADKTMLEKILSL